MKINFANLIITACIRRVCAYNIPLLLAFVKPFVVAILFFFQFPIKPIFIHVHTKYWLLSMKNIVLEVLVINIFILIDDQLIFFYFLNFNYKLIKLKWKILLIQYLFPVLPLHLIPPPLPLHLLPPLHVSFWHHYLNLSLLVELLVLQPHVCVLQPCFEKSIISSVDTIYFIEKVLLAV